MRENLKDKKRIVFKVGSSTLAHKETGALDLVKMEKFVRILTDLHNQGKEIVVVSSGAILVGRKALGNMERPTERETGLRSGWTVPPDDSVSKTFFGIQSKYRTDFDD